MYMNPGSCAENSFACILGLSPLFGNLSKWLTEEFVHKSTNYNGLSAETVLDSSCLRNLSLL